MIAALFIIAILVLIISVTWDLIANPYRIEERVLGDPPRKWFFIYERGYQIRSMAQFTRLDEAEKWIAAAKAARANQTTNSMEP